VTHGILFDVNSDRVKPESYGALKEISNVLTESADIKVQIVGHTDSDGDAAQNLDLAKRFDRLVQNSLLMTCPPLESLTGRPIGVSYSCVKSRPTRS
jgi:OmpA-OmpF porin, OOP family